MKSPKRTLVWLVPVTVLVIVGGWLLSAGRAPAAPAAASSAKAGDEAPAMPEDKRAAAETKLREVNETVAQKNREASKDREAFVAAGWQMVNVPPPDHAVLGYDPSLLAKGREHDLRMQLLSTVPSPDQAARVAEIARRAKDQATRYAAVEALGRLQAPEALNALYDLMTSGGLDPADEARQEIPPLLRPSALDDPMAQKIAMLLDSTSLTPVEKKQIAFTLALLGLRDGMTLDAATLSALSADSRNLLDQMTALAQSSFVKALQRKGGNP
jgi:hypothetical protein